MRSVLIVGGTSEGRELAARLDADGVDVLSSLAGRVQTPAAIRGRLRVGGFGGTDGLIHALRHGGHDAVIDATHPFAATMSDHVATACAVTNTPLLRLQRPGWEARSDAMQWHWASDLAAAREMAEGLGSRPFLTTGRQTLRSFQSWQDRYVLARIVEPLDWPPPTAWEIRRSRGPYHLADESELLRSRGIDVMVTKNSGGPLTEAKLAAARELNVPVVVVRRPPAPAGVDTVATVAEAASWIGSINREIPPTS